MKDDRKNPLFAESLATEAKQGTDNIQGLSSRVGRYAKAKERALHMSAYCNSIGDDKMGSKLGGCGNYLVFREYYTVDKVRLHAACFCKKHLLCPLCAIRRGSKAVTAYLEKYTAVLAQNPGLKPFLVTLTVKNGDDLDERMTHLRRSSKEMFQQRRNALKGQRHVEFAKAVGGFFSVEVTNRGNGWHPHQHMILLCYEAPDPRKLAREWQDITGDSFIVDVRPIEGDPVEGFIEVCKYALKFSDLSLPDNYHAFEVLGGQRLFDSFGSMRGVKIPESLLDEPLDDLPYVDLLYKYLNGSGYVFCKDNSKRE